MRKISKLFGMILSAAMLMNTISASAVTILPEDEDIIAAGAILPEKGDTLFRPEFPAEKTVITNEENSALHMVAVNSGETGEVYAENGKLVINRTSLENVNGFKMWINADKSVINDKPVAVSFDVQKSTDLGRVEFRLISSETSSQTVAVVLNDYKQPIISAQEAIGTNSYITDETVEIDSVNSPVTVTMMYNPTEKAVSAWITYTEEETEKTMLLCSGAMPRENTSDIFGLHAYSERGQEPCEITISNIEFWNAVPTALDEVNYIVNDLTLSTTSSIFDFELPQTIADYPITWTSDNSDIIAVDGYNALVTQPTDKETTVKLKASITVDGVTAYKCFPVKVAKDNRPPMVANSEYIFYEEFNYTAENTPVAQRGSMTVLPNSNGAFAGGCFYGTTTTGWGSVKDAQSVPVIENGKLVVKPTDTNVDNYGLVWLSKDGKTDVNLTDGDYRVAVDYDIETSNTTDKFHVTLNRGTHRQSTFVASDMRLGTASSSGLWINNGNSNQWIGRVPESKVRYTAVFNKDGNTFDLYKNGVLVANDYTRKSTDATLGSLCIAIDKGNTAEVSVDNIKVYYVGLSAQERIDAEYEKLIAGGFAAINSSEQTLVESDFSYTPSDEGISVKFSSNIEGLVNEDGTFNIEAGSKGTVDAKVTVTLSFNGCEKSVSYDFTAANDIVIKDMVETDSGWDGNGGYVAVYPAYTLSGKTYYCNVIIKAYDIETNNLIGENTILNKVTPKSELEDSNVIYGEIILDSTRGEHDTRIEVFIEKILEGVYISAPDSSLSSWNGDTYTAVLPAYSTANETQKVCVIVAAYKDGHMVSCSIDNEVVVPEQPVGDETEEPVITGSLTLEGGESACSEVRVFVWEDINNMVPVLKY